MSIQERKGIRVNNHLFMEEIRRMFNEKGKSSVTFVVRGYSMRPFVEHERDKVILVPPRTPKVGDVVLAEIAAKRYALHRVIKIKDGIYTMQGDGNPTSLVEHFTEEKIVGIANRNAVITIREFHFEVDFSRVAGCIEAQLVLIISGKVGVL